MPEDRKGHWNEVYSKRDPEDLTWFQSRPGVSLRLLGQAGLTHDSRIIDVGGGTSLFASFLLQEGFQNLSVLDVSDRALAIAKDQLGDRAREVEWFHGDVTTFHPPHQWDLWHDRAVFHFLTHPADREAYRRVLDQALAPGGHAVIATFALDGPDRCSGLECVRYSPETLGTVLGRGYRPRGSSGEVHRTPRGGTQKFVYSWFQKMS
jgi:SAM-dependent methyltransferase